MTSRLALALVAAAAATLAIVTAPASAARSCDVGNTRSYSTTYVTKISVTGVSCAKGKSVVRAFHACRPGKSGKCARAAGYRCTERRFNKSPLSYDSNVTCTLGGKRITHTYTQFT
jgi:hypothetical protein